jgi:transposase
MPYSSSLTDAEWEVFEPQLLKALPPKKKTCPMKWPLRAIVDAVLYQLKNGCNWIDLPKDFPPYSTVYWHYKKWRDAGVLEKLRDDLHKDVRTQVKKKRGGQP